MNKFKVGVIQSKVFGDKKDTLSRLIGHMEMLANEGADILVLPEMFNCPYQASNFPIYAEEEEGETWAFLSDCAKKFKIYIVGGSIPINAEGDSVYNQAFVFDRDGCEIASHKKMHLFDIDIKGGQRFKESETLSAGNDVTVFDTEFCKIGLAICYDIRFPELSRMMVNKGAQVIIVPGAFNMTTGPAHWELAFRGRALDNQVYTIGVAPARDVEASYHSFGHSLVVDPWGRVCKILDEKEGSFLFEIDLDYVTKIRDELPLLNHRRDDLYEVVYKG